MKPTICLTILAAVLLVGAVRAQQPAYDDRPKISVNGEAVVYVRPDKIVVTFGIETWDQNIMTAKERNGAIQQKAVAAFRRMGIPDKEIQTDHLSIEPRFRDSSYSKEGFIGYFVRNTLVVTLGDTGQVEELVTQGLQAGVTHIHGIQFETTEFKQYREQARELALKAAREKAEKMAAVLGQTVGAPVQIGEGYNRSYYHSGWWGGSRGSAMTQNVIQNIDPGGGGDGGESVALGKIAISANVNVTFLLGQ
jgi:uncharacterized protein YggE